MNLRLFIKGELIETVEIEVGQYPTFMQRNRVVQEYTGYLKTKYRMDIMITNKWEIILEAQSLINYEFTVD